MEQPDPSCLLSEAGVFLNVVEDISLSGRSVRAGAGTRGRGGECVGLVERAVSLVDGNGVGDKLSGIEEGLVHDVGAVVISLLVDHELLHVGAAQLSYEGSLGFSGSLGCNQRYR